MKELDFLPQTYHQAARQRVEFRHNLLMAVGLALAMGCLHGLNLAKVRSAEAALSALSNGQGGWHSARSLVSALEAKRNRARQRVELISQLDDAAPLDAAIGEVSRLLSDSMALRGLDMNNRAAGLAGATGSGPGQDPKPATAVTHVRMTGVAANDVEVGIFVGKLGACPLFSDISLSFSRDARSSGKQMRQFEVKFTIRPVEGTR